MSAFLREAIASELGSEVVSLEPCSGDGWTATSRLLAELADGRRCFVKQALTDTTSVWLRAEAANYRVLSATPLARMLGFIESERPALLLEDLSPAHWPPPWRPGDFTRAHDALDEIARDPAAPNLPELPARLDTHGGWKATNLDLLAQHLAAGEDPRSVAEELGNLSGRSTATGNDAVLLDARTGNVCVTEEGVKWVDLDGMARGNAEIAHALLDISAPSEARPSARRAEALAHVSGVWAEQLSEPAPEWAPELRAREAQLLHNALGILLRPHQLRHPPTA